MLINQSFTFTPQCHVFCPRDSQHYKVMEWIEIGQSADMRRRRFADVPDACTRASTLQGQPDAHRSRPLRTPPDVVSVYRMNPTQWTRCVHGQPDANRSRTVRASGKIVSVNTAIGSPPSVFTGSRFPWRFRKGHPQIGSSADLPPTLSFPVLYAWSYC